MVPGFNHNIKHKERIFHIQTEDSGAKNPHIITHLFVGGNILSSKKTTYAEIVGQPEYENTVRSMMEEQHKQMLRNLINGVYDEVETGDIHHLDGPAPLNTDPAVQSPSTAVMAGQNAHADRPSSAPAQVVAAPGLQNYSAAQEITADAVRADTVFGEDLISEKSLDEVILSYLAEDLADLD
ncbi:MAG: hypothetical protein GY822_25045 [Deltaproteobacteria bacterium]|nr:hypothetical protein [Deltaproteobacteria bacterium]